MSNLKKLSKFIYNYYWKDNQQLIVSTYEVMNGTTDYSLDVCLVDKENKPKYLFEIQTLDIFNNYECTLDSYFRENKFHQSSILWKSAHTLLYLNRLFTLKKFGSITKEDIINCTKYFCNEVLDIWFIFNIKFKEEN